MTDIAIRSFKASVLAPLLSRLLDWLDEPVTLGASGHKQFDERDWDLPVHHPLTFEGRNKW